jgi:hypothetical protein
MESRSELPAVMEDERESKSLQATIIFRKPTWMLRATLKNPTMIGSGVCKSTRAAKLQLLIPAQSRQASLIDQFCEKVT